jgi:hypothetical protein
MVSPWIISTPVGSNVFDPWSAVQEQQDTAMAFVSNFAEQFKRLCALSPHVCRWCTEQVLVIPYRLNALGAGAVMVLGLLHHVACTIGKYSCAANLFNRILAAALAVLAANQGSIVAGTPIYLYLYLSLSLSISLSLSLYLSINVWLTNVVTGCRCCRPLRLANSNKSTTSSLCVPSSWPSIGVH